MISFYDRLMVVEDFQFVRSVLLIIAFGAVVCATTVKVNFAIRRLTYLSLLTASSLFDSDTIWLALCRSHIPKRHIFSGQPYSRRALLSVWFCALLLGSGQIKRHAWGP